LKTIIKYSSQFWWGWKIQGQGERTWSLVRFYFQKLHLMTSFHLKDPPLPSTLSLGDRVSIYEFWGDSNIQILALSFPPECSENILWNLVLSGKFNMSIST
jgi:hypothetical protein